MRQFSCLKTIPLSFHSKALYRDVRTNWQGLGFSYLFFLLVLVTCIFSLYLSVMSLTLTYQKPIDIDGFLRQIPTLHFNAGELSADVTQPYYIRLHEANDRTVAIIDTTHDVNTWNTPDFRGFVLGKTQILERNDAQKSTINDYAKTTSRTITADDLRHVVQKLMPWRWLVPLLLAPFMVLPFFLYRIIQALLYGVCGLLMAKMIRTSLPYTDAVRLASVAVTPAILLNVLLVFILHINLPWFLYLALTMGYLWFAIKSSTEHA